MKVFLLLVHGVAAMFLLGAITHQTVAVWWPTSYRDNGFVKALRAVHAERYATAVVVLFSITTLVGAIDYAPFRAVTRLQYLDRHAPWATGLFEIKEHAAAIGLTLLPAYWAAWRASEAAEGRKLLTSVLAAASWWNFLVGHIVNNVRGL